MKVLLVLPSDARGGVEEYGLKIAKASAEKGWEVHVAFPNIPETGSLIEAFKKAGSFYHPLDILDKDPDRQNLRDQFLRFIRVLSLLWQVKPDVVQINIPWLTKGAAAIIACGFLCIPAQVVFHLVPEEKLLGKSVKLFGGWSQRRGQDWVAVSEHIREAVGKSYGVPGERIRVIRNGIRLPEISNTQEDCAVARARLLIELGLASDCKLIVTVGRLDRQKGYHDLLETAERIKAGYPLARFIWAGEGYLRPHLEEEIVKRKLGDTIFLLGYRDDVPQLLKAADLFVFPTYFEGFPFALLEAMAHQLPFISTDACGISELAVDGVHGLLCKAGDRESLVGLIRWALDHPENMKGLALAAFERVREFSEEAMLQKAVAGIEVLGEGGRVSPV